MSILNSEKRSETQVTGMLNSTNGEPSYRYIYIYILKREKKKISKSNRNNIK